MILFIKEYREYKKMTIRRLANKTHISVSYLDLIENNRANPTLDKLDKIGMALELCPIQLLGGCCGNICTPRCCYYKDI